MDTNNEEQQLFKLLQKAINKISNKEDIDKKIFSYVEQFLSESDRACILLTASMIDYRLKKILDRFFIPPHSKNDDILSEKGMNPLGTFSARHKIAYRLGLISSKLEKSISDIRDIRNLCAHEIEIIMFDDQSHNINKSLNDKIGNIVLQFEGMRDIFKKHRIKKREQFLLVATWIIAKLDYIILDISTCNEAKTESIFGDKIISKWGNQLEHPGI